MRLQLAATRRQVLSRYSCACTSDCLAADCGRCVSADPGDGAGGRNRLQRELRALSILRQAAVPERYRDNVVVHRDRRNIGACDRRGLRQPGCCIIGRELGAALRCFRYSHFRLFRQSQSLGNL